MTLPLITKTPCWTPVSVREACIRNDLYTLGDNESYSKMLDQVRKVPNPSDIGIWIVAKNIAENSENQTVTNVMYILANEAVSYTFKLDDSDEA